MSIYFSTNRHTGAGTWGQGAVMTGIWQFVSGGAIDVPVNSSLDARMEPSRLWYRSRTWNEINGLYSDWLASGPVSTLIDLAGTLSFVGGVVFKTMIGLAGVESFGGALAMQARPNLSASLSSAGNLQLQARPRYAGALAPAGQIILRTSTAFVGVLTSVGEFFKGLFRDFTGTLDQSGEIDAANIGEQQTDADDTKRWRKFQ